MGYTFFCFSLLGLLSLVSCTSQQHEQTIPRFHEKECSFSHLRTAGYSPTHPWIRQPENILMLHETFKKLGYKHLISDYTWSTSPFISHGIYLNHSLKNLIDSLELTYEDHLNAPTYYREFWQRRTEERNTESVYKVVKDIKDIMFEGIELEVDHEMVNDTLAELLSYEYPSRDLSSHEANELLSYLISIGFHESAYNLIRGEFILPTVKWERSPEEIMQELETSEEDNTPWFQDNTP
ncbi:MAG: hypothetical protein AAGC85_05445 [Bacteroidota bacterium]